MSIRYHLRPTAVRSSRGRVPLRFGEAGAVESRALPADVSDPEDHATGSYGHSPLASADHGTQEMPGTLGSPLTDSEGSTSPMVVTFPVNDIDDELGEPTLNRSYRTTMEEVPDEDTPHVPYARQLNQEQVDMVARARQSMTDDERERVDARNKKVFLDTYGDDDNPGESSRRKGKAVDPSNWEDAGLSESEHDPDVQQAMYEDINLHARKKTLDNRRVQDEDASGGPSEDPMSKSGREEPVPTRAELKERIALKKQLDKEIRRMHKEVKHIPKRKMRAEQKKRREVSLPVSTELGDLIKKLTDAKKSKGEVTKSAPKHTSGAREPINLITEDSALGRAFKNLRKKKDSPSDSSSSSSSDSGDESDMESAYSDVSRGSDSSSSSSSDSSLSSSSSSDAPGGRHWEQSSKRKHRRRKSKKRSNKKKSLIKPTLPDKYSGAADLQAFHRFLTQGTAYVK